MGIDLEMPTSIPVCICIPDVCSTRQLGENFRPRVSQTQAKLGSFHGNLSVRLAFAKLATEFPLKKKGLADTRQTIFLLNRCRILPNTSWTTYEMTGNTELCL